MKKIMFFAAVLCMATFSACFKSGLERDLYEVHNNILNECEVPGSWASFSTVGFNAYIEDSIQKRVRPGDLLVKPYSPTLQCLEGFGTGDSLPLWRVLKTGATLRMAPGQGPLFLATATKTVCPLKGVSSLEQLKANDSLLIITMFSHTGGLWQRSAEKYAIRVTPDSVFLTSGSSLMPFLIEGSLLKSEQYVNGNFVFSATYNFNSQSGTGGGMYSGTWHYAFLVPEKK